MMASDLHLAPTKKPMPSSSATRRLVVFLAYLFSVGERFDAGFLKALPHFRWLFVHAASASLHQSGASLMPNLQPPDFSEAAVWVVQSLTARLRSLSEVFSRTRASGCSLVGSSRFCTLRAGESPDDVTVPVFAWVFSLQ